MYFILNKFDNPFVTVIKFGFLFFLPFSWSLNWKLGHFCITFLLITSIFFRLLLTLFIHNYSKFLTLLSSDSLLLCSSALSSFLYLCISLLYLPDSYLVYRSYLFCCPLYYFPLSHFLFLYSFLLLDLFLTSFLFLFSFHWSYITLHYLIALHIFPTSQNSLATAPPPSLSSLPLALLLLLLLLPACLCAIFFNVCFVDWL